MTDVLFQDNCLTIATCDGVFLMLWVGQPQRTHYQAIDILFAQEVRTRGTPFFVLDVVSMNVPSPSKDVRSFAAEVMKRIGENTVAWADVIEGNGMRKAMIRTLMATWFVMSGVSFPARTFPSTTEAVMWALQFNVINDPDRIVAEERRLRSTMAKPE